MMTVSSDPTQVLRTATKGIGTDSYRAPEVNGLSGYDPSLADVWSLGVTLFFMVSCLVLSQYILCTLLNVVSGSLFLHFLLIVHYNVHHSFYTLSHSFCVQVGIEEMVAKVKSLDHFTRQLVAPLGIVFPFPLHCSKLDCYMNACLADKGVCMGGGGEGLFNKICSYR